MQFHLDSKQMVYRWILIDLVPLNSNWPDKSTRKKKKLRKLSTEKKQQHFFFSFTFNVTFTISNNKKLIIKIC